MRLQRPRRPSGTRTFDLEEHADLLPFWGIRKIFPLLPNDGLLGSWTGTAELTQNRGTARLVSLYLIEAGQVDVHTSQRNGGQRVLTTLGPGDYFGEIALITGGEQTADVVAVATTTLLRLPQKAYSCYLAHLIEVESQLTRTALSRSYAKAPLEEDDQLSPNNGGWAAFFM